MTNEDKSIVVAGTMFLTLSTALFITGIFFMKALGTALLIALATYVFFDTCYYVKKDWLLLPIANSPSVHKIIRTLKIQNYSEVVNYD